MYTNKDGSLGLVSNLSETEIQGISAHENSTALVSNVRTLSWYERHVNKRHVGQISNGMLIDPRRRIAADLGKLTGRDWAGGKILAVCLFRNVT